MIESKLTFFSPIHRNNKFDLFVFLLLLFMGWVILIANESLLEKLGSLVVVSFYLIISKINDFYTIIESRKNTVLDFKEWLNFIETKMHKTLMKLIYVYYSSSLILFILSFIYFFSYDSYQKRIYAILAICGIMLHLAGTFFKYKKIKL